MNVLSKTEARYIFENSEQGDVFARTLTMMRPDTVKWHFDKIKNSLVLVPEVPAPVDENKDDFLVKNEDKYQIDL